MAMIVIVIVVMQDVEIRGAWLFFDDDYNVIEERRESLGQRVERLFDEALELGGIDGHYQPAMMLKPVTQPCVGRWNGFAA